MKLNYFNFKPFGDHILMTNDFGKYLFVTPWEFKQIISEKIEPNCDLWERLTSTGMIYTCTDLEFTSQHKDELREFKGYLSTATSLHIFVVTTVCNLSCVYCQANNDYSNSNLMMNAEIAEKSVDIALQSPTKNLYFEFQGGEPLLNFQTIRHIVEYTERNKGDHIVNYSIVSNLTLLTDEMLDYIALHNIEISTSLDGSEHVHDNNRKFSDGNGSFHKVCKAIERVRKANIYVGAIETTTRYSLMYPEEIVHTYAELGFNNIFIRPLTPLGKANSKWDRIGYSSEEFIDFYIKAVDEMIKINKAGTYIKENHISIFLNKIHGHSMNYMELRSPCGAGMGQIAYYPDGNVFTCDEGRMFYEMGKDTFLLGNVDNKCYNDLIENSVCKTVCASSILESIPGCCDCAFQPYCGICPVVNYAQDSDILEKHPRSYRCKIYSGILEYIFSKLYENEEQTVNILNSWIK